MVIYSLWSSFASFSLGVNILIGCFETKLSVNAAIFSPFLSLCRCLNGSDTIKSCSCRRTQTLAWATSMQQIYRPSMTTLLWTLWYDGGMLQENTLDTLSLDKLEQLLCLLVAYLMGSSSAILSLSFQNAYVNISRIVSVATRLCEAGHYAAAQIQQISGQLDQDWKSFASPLEERSAILTMSSVFHQKSEQVFFFWHIKGLVHPKMRIPSLITHPCVGPDP